VLCDLDAVLLDSDGNMPQVARDVVQLYCTRGGRVTVFSQHSPRAVRTLLGSVRVNAPVLACGGSLVYNLATGESTKLCDFGSFATDLFEKLPAVPGVGIALQMKDGATRVLRMSKTLQEHLKKEWTPYFLSKPEDIQSTDVLRVLLYQDGRVKALQLFEKALIESAVPLYVDRLSADVLALTPKALNGGTMLHALCTASETTEEQVAVVAGSLAMLEMVQHAGWSAAAANAPAEVRVAAREVTLSNAQEGAAVEYLYRQVRSFDASDEKNQ
jgi:hydroxymethylpyrimidine pyrophosphatase-like HAD family hydrolase